MVMKLQSIFSSLKLQSDGELEELVDSVKLEEGTHGSVCVEPAGAHVLFSH